MTGLRRSHRLIAALLPLTLALPGLFSAPVAAAEQADAPVRAVPQQISALLSAAKYSAEIKSDDEGRNYIVAKRNDRNFRVFFYGCNQGVRVDCTSIQFYIAFTIDKPFPVERVNEWNRDNRFGRAYVDSNQDAVIEMDVNLNTPGMSSRLFTDTLDLWFEVMDHFDDFVFTKPPRQLDGKSIGNPSPG